MEAKTWSTRLDAISEKRIKQLLDRTRLKEAEVLRRLIMIGLSNIKHPADLLTVEAE